MTKWLNGPAAAFGWRGAPSVAATAPLLRGRPQPLVVALLEVCRCALGCGVVWCELGVRWGVCGTVGWGGMRCGVRWFRMECGLRRGVL